MQDTATGEAAGAPAGFALIDVTSGRARSRARSGGRVRRALVGVGLALSAAAATQQGAAAQSALLLDPLHPAWGTTAPDTFRVAFRTSEGDFVLEAVRDWAPQGVDRFYNLVRHGFYDDSRFYRVVEGFIAQFGLPGDPTVTPHWLERTIPDDPVVASNERGTVAFAFTDPGTRTTQVYVNLADNRRLDADGFAPFARVIEGMEVVDRLYAGYGESAGGGLRRGDQSRIWAEGNAHLDAEYPELSKLENARIVPRDPLLDASALREYVEDFRGRGQLPGIAVVVTDRNGPLFVETFGGAEVGGGAFTTSSAVYIGSTTKTMTALGVLQLAEAGKIDLDRPVLDYLPSLDFPPGEPAGALTTRHLLTHAGGLPRMAAFQRRVQQEGRLDRVRFFADPGDRVEYSSLNFLLLGQLIETVSGQAYGAYMAEHVFGPLGMAATTVDRDAAATEGLAQGHTYVFGWPVARSEPTYAERMIPTGYVLTTAEDLGRYLSALLAASQGAGTAAVSPGVASLMATPRTGDLGVSHGWGITRLGGERALYHAGMTPGFHALLAVMPDVDRAVAVVSTRNAGPFLDAPRALLDGVIEITMDREAPPYFPWERSIRLGILVLLVGDLIRPFRLAAQWRALGRPRAMAHTVPVIGRVLFDITLAVAIPLWIVLGLAKLPIQDFLEFYPDLGVALILFPLLALPSAVLRSVVSSEKWRQEVAAAAST